MLKNSYFVPSSKPYRPAGYWSNHDKVIYTLLIILVTLAAASLAYIFFSMMNLETSNQVNKWRAIAKAAEIEVRNLNNELYDYRKDPQCSKSQLPLRSRLMDQ